MAALSRLTAPYRSIGWRIVFFSFLALVWYLATPRLGTVAYGTLIFGVVVWLLYESGKLPAKGHHLTMPAQDKLFLTLKLGIILAALNFVVQNLGSNFNLWQNFESILFLGNQPIEIAVVAVLGMSAWALTWPNKFDKKFVLADSIVFAGFASLGEYLLVQNWIIQYINWNIAFSFVTYFSAWILITLVWYRVLNK